MPQCGVSLARPRVLVVEGDPEVRAILGEALQTEGYEVRTEADGDSIAEVVQEHRPDLAILGAHYTAGPDPCELTRSLRRTSDLPILVLDPQDSASTRVAALEAGADDVLAAPLSVREVLGHAQVLLRRAGRLVSPVRQVGDLIVDEDARTAIRAGQLLDLTRTEFDLLSLFARNPERVLPKRQLFSEVWGWGDFDAHLVEVHLSSLRRKLETHGPRLIETVRGDGYMLIRR